MNEATWLIIIGLGIDILGALIIIGLLRTRKSLFKKIGNFLTEITDRGKTPLDERFNVTPETNRDEIEKIKMNLNEKLLEDMKEYTKLILGGSLLVLGFILQIIGNWILNPPF